MVHAAIVLLLTLAVGCTGFVTSVAALSVTWLVPSVRRDPPMMVTEKRPRYIPLVPPRVPPLRSAEPPKRAESVPRPETIRRVSFEVDEPGLTTPTPAPASAPSSPRGHSIPLPRCKGHTLQSRTIPLPSVPLPLPITAVDSPLSSAETLSEMPAEVKRAFSSRLTRVFRGRRLSRCSTIASTTGSSSSATVASEFSEYAIPPGKTEMRPILDVKQRNVTERGRFAFLKKSKTIDDQTRSLPLTRPPLSLASPLTSNANSSADSLLPPCRTNSPVPLSPSLSTGSEPSQHNQHRRIMSSPSAAPRLRLADKICSRKEKDKGAEPKPKPTRTQPYGPPYNWIPPAPGAWAVAEADKHSTTAATERRRKRVSAPVVASIPEDVTRHGHEPPGSLPRPRRPTIK